MLVPAITPLAFSAAAHDILIVGGGTAGLTLAARLSEDLSINVGVIEAGFEQFDNPEVNIPGFFGMPFGTELDWNFHSVPQEHVNGTILAYPRGRMLGGSSGLNYMLWNRANQQDYDDWELLGNPGWGWSDILPLSMKTERFIPPDSEAQLRVLPDPPFNPEFHGRSGGVVNSFGKSWPQTIGAFQPTLEALGIPQNPDTFDGSDLNGYISLQSIDPSNSTRSYSATAYLRPNLGRKNLVVMQGAQATKIVLNGTKAVGVEFVVNGTTFQVAAEKEVVLSAGAFQSPQVLELSGIGNCTLLQSVGVDCKVDLPSVGENLQDHVSAPVVYEYVPGIITSELSSNATLFAEWEAEYFANRSGPLSSGSTEFAMIALTSFLNSTQIDSLVNLAKSSVNSSVLASLLRDHLSNATIPDIEISFNTGKLSSVDSVNGSTHLTVVAGIMHPFSLGSVHINTSDALAPPLIDPQLYKEPVDKALMLEAIKFMDKIMRTKPVSNFLTKRAAPASQGSLTDEQWAEYLLTETGTEFHPVGSCSMLPKEDGGVVDTKLRVYGVDGLRVVDASVIPKHVAVHPQDSVYSVAEKAAVLMKEDLAGS